MGLGVLSGAPAQTSDLDSKAEYKLRAAFLVTFAKYTQWPEVALPAAGEDFVVGVLGADPFGPALDTIQGALVQGRKVVVKRFRNPSDVHGCQVLYVPRRQEAYFPALRERLAAESVLTVGETLRFSEIGGAVYLLAESDRLRFIVNLGSLERAHLRVEAGALNLAKRVIAEHEKRP